MQDNVNIIKDMINGNININTTYWDIGRYSGRVVEVDSYSLLLFGEKEGILNYYQLPFEDLIDENKYKIKENKDWWIYDKDFSKLKYVDLFKKNYPYNINLLGIVSIDQIIDNYSTNVCTQLIMHSHGKFYNLEIFNGITMTEDPDDIFYISDAVIRCNEIDEHNFKTHNHDIYSNTSVRYFYANELINIKNITNIPDFVFNFLSYDDCPVPFPPDEGLSFSDDVFLINDVDYPFCSFNYEKFPTMTEQEFLQHFFPMTYHKNKENQELEIGA